jgi:hypothetical protein
MAVAAAVALAVAVPHEDSRPTVGSVIVATCIAYLTYKLATDRLAVREAEGERTSRSQWARIVAKSAANAVAVLGVSDIVFLVVYWGYMLYVRSLVSVDHFWPWEEPQHILIGTLAGGIAALLTVPLTTRLIRLPAARPTAGHSSSPVQESPASAEVSNRARL